MAATIIGKEKQTEVIVMDNIKDYSQEPSFKKKEEKAKEFLQKHGLPESFVKKGK